VVGGVVYVGYLWDGHNGYVIALNATTGALVWRFATNSGIESSPAIVNGVVYIGSFYGYIYALNATNGALIWSYLTGGSTYSSPAIVDGVSSTKVQATATSTP
jgi:outer membrane protein assembly factor BamB